MLVIAWSVFWCGRPVVLLFSRQHDFLCRRNAWFALTVAAFLCPSLWLLCLVAAIIIRWAARRDSNPSALYLMLLYALPEFSWKVPMVGMSSLVSLDLPMLLSLCLMVPAALRITRSQQPPAQPRLLLADYCLLAYLGLTSVYFLLVEVAPGVLMTWTFTNCLRRAVVAFLVIYVPFFVISRSSRNTAELQDTLATFCLAGSVMAAIGVFEGSQHWLLYGDLQHYWDPKYNPYLERGGTVRAMASASHSLIFGYLLAVAFGIWLGLMSRVQSARWRIGAIVLYWLGLLASYSRGPWLGGVIIYFGYVGVSGRRLSTLLKAAVTAGLLGAILLASPVGDRIQKAVPFLGGTLDAGSITYRERLADRAWKVVEDSPLLGDQYALLKLQDLRMAGIIDLMNGFVNILLDNGFIGLTLFLCFVLVGLYKGWTLSGDGARTGPDLAKIIAALVACLLGTMLMMYAGGLMIAPITVLVALICSCARICAQQSPGLQGPPSSAAVSS